MDTKKLLSLVPDMSKLPAGYIDAFALGIQDAVDINARFKVDRDTWEFLSDSEEFSSAVETRREELRSSGDIMRAKATIIAEDVLDELFLRVRDPETSPSVLLETLKVTSRMAGVDAPKPEGGGEGNQFIINIDLSAGGGQSVSVAVAPIAGNVYESEPSLVGDEPIAERMGSAGLPPLPAHLIPGGVLDAFAALAGDE